MNVQKSYCTAPGVGTGVVSSGDKMLKFYVKVFYVMGDVLSGELSCMLTGLVLLIVEQHLHPIRLFRALVYFDINVAWCDVVTGM